MCRGVWLLSAVLVLGGCGGRAGTVGPTPARAVSPVSNEAFAVTQATRDASGVTAQGRARVFEATFAADVLDAGGRVLTHSTVHAGAGAPAWGDFTARLPLPEGTPATGLTMRLYEPSAKDGTPLHGLTVALN